MIGVQFYGNNIYMNPIYSAAKVNPVGSVSGVEGGTVTTGTRAVEDNHGVTKSKECQTCAKRKYQDGSDEANVSFKTPGHISPAESKSKVMGHELEHVANARREGMQDNKELISASVSLKIGVCPECGKTYIAGGETRTTMKTTYDNGNPYDSGRKTIEGSYLSGMNVDYSA